MYNPGYWVNRIPFGFPPKPSRGFYILAIIDVVLMIPAFILLLWLYVSEPKPTLLFMVISYGAFAMLALLRLRRLRPTRKPPTLTDGQPVQEPASNDQEAIYRDAPRNKKRKLPKRRKDYH